MAEPRSVLEEPDADPRVVRAERVDFDVKNLFLSVSRVSLLSFSFFLWYIYLFSIFITLSAFSLQSDLFRLSQVLAIKRSR